VFCGTVLQTNSSSRLQRSLAAQKGQGLAWLSLVVAVALTLALWRYSVEDFADRAEDRFLVLAERQRGVLTDRMRDYERRLQGAAGLFAASGAVTRAEWRAYVQHMESNNDLPGTQGTGYVAIVPLRQKTAHEQAVRAEGFPGYTIYPPGNRDPLTSILYIEPFSGRNLRAFGYDMYAEPVRRAAMDLARDTGKPALSGKVVLVQDSDAEVQPGFLMYVPIYDNASPRGTVEQRRAALTGFAFSPFRAVDAMRGAFGTSEQDVEVEVYDGAPVPANLLFASNAARSATHQVDTRIEFGGREWTARFRSSAGLESTLSTGQPTIILTSGLALSLLLFAVLYGETLHNRRLEKQVEARTRELLQARDEAQSASRAKSAFLATVSHELRTPLNAIIGFSTLLLEDSTIDAAERRKQLSIIHRSGMHLLDLIEEMLDLTSIEAGHIAVDIMPLRLHEVLAEQCESMQVQAHAARLDLRVEAVDHSLIVLADPVRLRQVVRNLLSNAIKFTDHGSVTIRARVDDGMARVEVEDTGIGIASDQQDSLFNRFQRIPDNTGRLRPGTGLGLSICRRLVEAMSGTAGVASEAGRGSVFWFTLPLARSDIATG
jgi:signal transduction histidine kinase